MLNEHTTFFIQKFLLNLLEQNLIKLAQYMPVWSNFDISKNSKRKMSSFLCTT